MRLPRFLTKRTAVTQHPGSSSSDDIATPVEVNDPWWLLWKNALPQYGVTLAQYFVPLLTLPYLTRVLGADVYGQVVLLTAFVSYFQLLVEFGFNLSAATSVARDQGDLAEVSRIRSAVFRSRLQLSVVSALAFAILLVFTSFADGFEPLAVAYFVSALLNAFIPLYVFRGLELMPSLSALLVGSRVLFAALIFMFVRSPADVLWVPVSNSLGSLVVICYALWYFKRKLHLPKATTSRRSVLASTRVSFPYFMDAVASTAFSAFTVVFISSVGLPLNQIAIWGAAYQIIAAAQSMYTPIMASLLPRMSRTLDWRLVLRLLTFLLPAVLLASSVLFVLADLAMRIVYGPEFADGGAVLRALIPVLVLSFPALLFGAPILGSVGKQKEMASTTIAAGVMFIMTLGVLWWLDAVSLISVALLRGVAEFVLLALRVWYLRSYYHAD